jgi:serine/threonine protein kinase/Flp pilus assembly protein TadD
VSVLLGERPELEGRKSLVLELAYEEFCRRMEKLGEALDVDSFCRRFPLCRYSLQRRIEVHQFLEQEEARWLAPTTWPQEGDEYLSFHLLEELGRGGASRVFLAEERDLGNRRVVVKVSTYGYREAQILSRLEHPNIVPVYSVEEDHEYGLVAICMPFVSRWTLLDLMDVAYRDGRSPGSFLAVLEGLRQQAGGRAMPHADRRIDPFLKRASFVDGMIHLMVQLADALRHTHRHGVLHLDLKPTNALITPEGRPLLLDFNLAVDDPTREAVLGGTLPYMSPEQIRASVLEHSVSTGQVDCRSDVFSLGVMICELLGGSHPFGPVSRGELPSAAAERVLQRQRERPATALARVSGIDPAVRRLVRQCLQTEPADRPQTADELHAKLDACLKLPRRAERWVRTHPGFVTFVALVFMAVALGAGVFAMTRDPYSVRLYDRGRQHYASGDYKAALRDWSLATDVEPEVASYWFARARARQKLGDFSGAIPDYWKAHQRSDDVRCFAGVAYCYARLVKMKLAEFNYEKAISNGWETAEVDAGLGYVYYKSNRLDMAVDALNRAARRKPDLPEMLYMRALTGARRAEQEHGLPGPSVLADIEKAMVLLPESPCVVANAAAIYLCDMKHEHAEIRRDTVLDLLQKAVSRGLVRTSVASYRTMPEFRADPRFDELVERAPEKPDYEKVEALIPDPFQGAPPILPVDVRAGKLRGR